MYQIKQRKHKVLNISNIFLTVLIAISSDNYIE